MGGNEDGTVLGVGEVFVAGLYVCELAFAGIGDCEMEVGWRVGGLRGMH